MTTDEARDVLQSCESLRESVAKLEWKAFMHIVCDRTPTLRVVDK